MVRANIAEFKTRMSHFIKILKGGDRVILCERNVPIAEIRPIPAKRIGKRVFGQHRGEFRVPDEVWAPLTDAELEEMFGDAF